MGWLILSLVASLVVLLLGHQLLRRAVPSRECVDFSSAGKTAHWNVVGLSELSGPVGAFVREVLAEPSASERIDRVCERLAEVDAETGPIPERLAMLARTILAMGALFGIVAIAEALRGVTGWIGVWGLSPFLLSAVVSFWCGWMGRVASNGIKARRQAWDTLSGLLVRPHMLGQHLEGGNPGVRGSGVRSAETRGRQWQASDDVMFGVQ